MHTMQIKITNNIKRLVDQKAEGWGGSEGFEAFEDFKEFKDFEETRIWRFSPFWSHSSSTSGTGSNLYGYFREDMVFSNQKHTSHLRKNSYHSRLISYIVRDLL